MTPETRAARDRIAAFLGTWERIAGEPTADALMTLTALEPPTGQVRLTRSDLYAVLAELDRYDGFEQAARETARQVAEAGFAVSSSRPVEITYQVAPRGECEGCGCCTASGCHRWPDSVCPTNSLGESVCPCTEG